VPPSPGFDVAAVLNEAVAARGRRIVRDAALLLLAVLLLVTAPPALLFYWVLAAVLLRVFSGARRLSLRALTLPGARWRGGGWQAALSGFVGLGLLAVLAARVGASVTGSLIGDSADSYSGYSPGSYSGYSPGPADHSAQYLLAGVFLLATLAVLAADRAAVWSALTGRLRYRVQNTGHPRRIHSLAPASHNKQVQRVRDAQAKDGSHPDETPLVVYRGYSPFVGSGHELNAWSVATSLIPLPPGSNGQLRLDPPGPGGSGADPAAGPTAGPGAGQLTTSLLYERVRAEIGKLVRSTPLTPSRRLRELSVSGVVVASANELVDHREDPSAPLYLPSLSGPPNRWLPRAEAERVRADPKEWARYYQCYRVETWDRELVVSMFVHLAVDEGTLYVEWKPYVLMPIQPAYKAIDYLSGNQLIPFGQAVWRLVTLPASMPSRVGYLARWPRRLPVDRGLVNPNRYGSLNTLRELAASDDVQNYLQRSDVYRYLKILESRFVLVISGILREFGYSSTTFDQVTANAAASNFFMGNNFNAPVTLGPVGTLTSTSTMTVHPPAPPAI
jgi:hypothetical protein